MDTDSFKVYIKTGDIYLNNGKVVEERFDSFIMSYTDHYLEENINSWVNEKLVRQKIMKEFGALTAKTYSCLTANNNEDKKAKGTKSAQ